MLFTEPVKKIIEYFIEQFHISRILVPHRPIQEKVLYDLLAADLVAVMIQHTYPVVHVGRKEWGRDILESGLQIPDSILQLLLVDPVGVCINSEFVVVWIKIIVECMDQEIKFFILSRDSKLTCRARHF